MTKKELMVEVLRVATEQKNKIRELDDKLRAVTAELHRSEDVLSGLTAMIEDLVKWEGQTEGGK